MVQADNDIIRGLGFVTIYSAWVEKTVDDILRQLSSIRAFDARVQRWPIGRKLERAAQTVEQLQSKQLQDLPALLRDGVALFTHRNELIHGRIFAGYADVDYLESGRPDVPTRAVTAAEFYALANNLANYRLHLIRPQVIRLPAAITSNSPSK